MLWALEPLLILFLAAWWLRERVTLALVILSLVAVGGMLLVIYQPGGAGSAIGVLLTVAGVGCCAVYTVITRRWISTSESTAQVVVAQQACALALAFIFVSSAWILGGAVVPGAVSPIGLASAEPSQWLGVAVVLGAIAVILGRTSGAEVDELADGQPASGVPR
jgi:drug/metabolite transporter (DMT)-like permease